MKHPFRTLLPLVPAMLVGLWMVLSFVGQDPNSVPVTKTLAPAVESVPANAPLTLSQSIQAANNVSLKQAAPDAPALIKLENATFQPHWDDQRNRPFYTIAEPSVTSLRKVVAGDKLSLPLPDHGIVEVTVHASLQDEQRESMWSIGGEIGNGEGSLYLAEDRNAHWLSGVVMLRNRREAWVYARQGAGVLTVSQVLVSEIVCTGPDGLPPIGSGESSSAAATLGGGIVPLNAGGGSVPSCSSRPGASAVLYLDFEPGTLTQTFWNSGRPIAYESVGLSTNQMISLWSQVAEDYSSFNVNVTTVRSSYTAATVGRRMRIVLTKTAWQPSINTGFAAIGSFPNAGGFWSERSRLINNGAPDVNKPEYNGISPFPAGYGPTGNAIAFPSDIVCWAFTELFLPLETTVLNQTRFYARLTTHELGHTFGLRHDSVQTGPTTFTQYYNGHGSNEDSWTPNMGRNYTALAQWSKGEYSSAYNFGWGLKPDGSNLLQDDLAMIGTGVSGGVGNGLIADDRGDSIVAATLLTIDGVGAATGQGMIHTETDVDFYRIPVAGPSAVVALNISASGQDPNLDLRVELQNSSGNILSFSEPTNQRDAIISPLTLSGPGNYYLMVRGSAQGTPVTGWSRYGSLGNYSISGSLSGSGAAPIITSSSLPPDASVGISYTFPITANFTPTTYYLISGTIPPGLLLSPGNLSGVPTTQGWYNFTLAAANSLGGTSKFFSMYVMGPATLEESLDTSTSIIWTSSSPPVSPAVSLWQGQRSITQDGSDAARSGSIGSNAESILTTNIKGPGKLTFYWRTSSHSSDRLSFKQSSTEQFNIGGETAWEQKTVHITGSGTYELSWIYRTDGGTTAGQNAGFVDRVAFLPYPDFADGNFYAGGRIGQAFLRDIPLEGIAVPTTWALTGGSLPPGIGLDPSTGRLSGVPNTIGTYSPEITATNSAGSSTTYPDIFIYPDISLAAGLDAEGLVWTTDPVNPWFGDTAPNHDGVDTAHSGPIRHGLSSWMQTTVTGPGTFSFWWKASTESPEDPVHFSLDGVVQASISGGVDWVQRSYVLGAGIHSLRWEYARDNGGNGGSNMVWVDQVNWITPGPTITNPLTVDWTVGVGYSVDLTSDDPNVTWSTTGTIPSDMFFLPTSKVIGAVPRTPRVVSFTIHATNTSGTTTSRLFTANIESSYTAWARTKGLAVGTPLGDPDKDGIVNLAECAFALEPNVRNNGFQPVSFDPVTKRLRAIFNRRHQYYPDLKYEVQVSSDLQNWISIARVEDGGSFINVGAQSITQTQVSPQPDPVYQATVVDGTAQSPAVPKRHMRVKITQL